MTYASPAIETAAIARMRADTELQGLMTSATATPWNIYALEGVPTGTAFPYIVAGIPLNQVGTAETMTLAGNDLELQVSILTQADASGGFKQARAIAKRVYDLFDRQALDLSASGISNIFLKFASSTEEPQDDGLTQHIPMRFRLMTQG